MNEDFTMKRFLSNDQDINQNENCTYTIKAEGDSESVKTILVKRIDMVYNNLDCHVLNFSDLTSILSLQR